MLPGWACLSLLPLDNVKKPYSWSYKTLLWDSGQHTILGDGNVFMHLGVPWPATDLFFHRIFSPFLQDPDKAVLGPKAPELVHIGSRQPQTKIKIEYWNRAGGGVNISYEW